jgi:cyclopropane fatty-acyl-phospholipid synthase-like methyltransferase
MKNFNDLKQQWNNVSKGTNWRGYIAAGNELEHDFKISGQNWVKHLSRYLYKFGISLNKKIVVEVGCGAGRMTYFLCERAKKVFGIDISSGLIKIANNRIKKGKHIEFLCIEEDFKNLKVIKDLSVDLIFSVAVFQHCSEEIVEKYFKFSNRVLKNNGYFVFQIPIALKHETIPYEPEPAVDMTYWTLDEILELAIKNNYSIINIPKDTNSNGKEYFIFKKGEQNEN